MAEPAKEETPAAEPDAEMAAEEKPAAEAAGEEKAEAKAAEAKDAAPKEPEKPKELEEDAPTDGRARLTSAVGFNTEDTTLNTLLPADGKLLVPLAEGGFVWLLAGARANVGVKAGRYLFEAAVLGELGGLAPAPVGQAQQKPPQQKPAQPVVRLGFAAAGSSLLISGASKETESIYFDTDGFCVYGNNKKRVCQKLGSDQTVALLLNLDAGSPNCNTVSFFRNGVRACEPQPLPESLRGRALFPAVAVRSASLRLNFSEPPLRALPFRCRMLGDAAAADCEVAQPQLPADGRYEVAVPVALPDEGGFDWVDQFLAKHPRHVELSSRALVDWAEKSGIWRKSSNKGCNDRPESSFGVPQLDDLEGFVRLLGQLAPALPRNYVVPEIRGNLVAESRKALLERFPNFRKTSYVMLGSPSEGFKEGVQAVLLREKRAKAEAEARRKKAEAQRKKALEEKKRKAKAAKEGGEAAEAEEADAEKAEPEEEEPPVELTEEEKKTVFRKKALPDMLAAELGKDFAKFSVPDKAEGFDDLHFEWQGAASASEYLRDWVLKRKATQRVEDIQPGKWFKDAQAEWGKSVLDWKKKQTEWKKVLEQLQQWKKEGKSKDDKGDDIPMETNSDDIDPMRVENICDVGSGEPLFAKFEYEDWCLLSLRYELHILVHGFRRDIDDPDRKTFHESHLSFYFSKYLKKQLDLKVYQVPSNADLMRLIQDTMAIDESSGMLEAQLADDSPLDSFVKLTEEHRRDRQRRFDAGDETSLLKFKPVPKQPTAPPAGQWQKGGAQRPQYVPARPATPTGAVQPGKVAGTGPKTVLPTATRPAGPAVVGAKTPQQALPRGVQPLRKPTPGPQTVGAKRPFAPAPKAGMVQPTKQARTTYGGRGW